MDHKKIIVIGVIVLGILTLFMFNGPSNKAVSPNILYLTQPVNSFSGIVDKIEGNKLTVSQKLTASQNLLPLAANPLGKTAPLVAPKVVTITFKAVISDKTQIFQSPSFINYLFKTTPLVGGAPGLPTASTPKMSVKDIKIGQIITVNTVKDLRTLTGDTFEATMINLPQIANTLNGKIVSLEGNVLTIKGFSQTMAAAAPIPANSAPAVPQEKNYIINITQDTEISHNIYDSNVNPGALIAPKPEKLSIGDLKKNMQVTVYTAEDVTESQTLTALRIEPAQVMPSVVPLAPPISPPTPSVSTSPSATTSPSAEL